MTPVRGLRDGNRLVAHRLGLRRTQALLWGLAASFLLIDGVLIVLASAFQHELPRIEPWLKALRSAYLLALPSRARC